MWFVLSTITIYSSHVHHIADLVLLWILVDENLYKSHSVHSQPRRPAIKKPKRPATNPKSWFKIGTDCRPRKSTIPLYSSLLRLPPTLLHPSLGSSRQERLVRMGPEKGHKNDQSTSPMKTGWNSQGCSDWRREGSGDASLWPSSTLKGLIKRREMDFFYTGK